MDPTAPSTKLWSKTQPSPGLNSLATAYIPRPTAGIGRFRLSERTLEMLSSQRFLREALTQINPGRSADAIDEAVRQMLTASGPSLIQANRAFHHLADEWHRRRCVA